jgi:hypothetical protein
MKKTISILILLVVLSGCDKKELVPDRLFEGSWTWVSSTGGIDGRTETPETEGQERSVVFTKTHKRSYVNGELISDREYYLQRGGSLYEVGVVEILVYETGFKQSYVLEGNRLLLRDECNDCFQHEYLRQ